MLGRCCVCLFRWEKGVLVGEELDEKEREAGDRRGPTVGHAGIGDGRRVVKVRVR